MIAVVVAVLVVALAAAALSDRRDRRGDHAFRPAGEMTATGRRVRRQARWRRAQLDRSVLPPPDLDDRS